MGTEAPKAWWTITHASPRVQARGSLQSRKKEVGREWAVVQGMVRGQGWSENGLGGSHPHCAWHSGQPETFP